jgi:pimeloyl-ACP methyl ester carboxylesterase
MSLQLRFRSRPKPTRHVYEPRWLVRIRPWLNLLDPFRLLRWAFYIFVAVWIYRNYLPDRPLDELKQRYAFPDSQFVPVEGMEVHCRITGQGEPFVLLHDADNSLHTWTSWTDSLARHYRVISVDLPGFGLTGPHPHGSYSAFMYANFLEAFVGQLGLERFHLAGNGIGAEIAWFYAAEHRDRLHHLVLLDAPGFEPPSRGWLRLLARTPVLNRILWKITPREFLRLHLEQIFTDDQQVTPALLQRHLDLLLRPGNRKAFTDRAQVSNNRPPVEELIQRISVPTLILWGAEDTQISPRYAYEFHRLIPGSLLKIYQNTGHWPQQENAAQTAHDVLEFLADRF